jgi:hypothetical protein
MKNMKFILVLFFAQQIMAQDPQLFENTWYLQNVIVNGNNNVPPSNDEISFVPLNFEETNMLFETSVCNTGSGELVFDNTNTNFSFNNGLSVTLLPCDLQENNDFETIYFNFYLSDITEPFGYEIINEGNNTISLIVSSLNGNTAIYNNALLSIQEISESKLIIYPNPVSTTLNISEDVKILNSEIKIFDTFGKVLNVYIFNENSTEINISNLNSGVYFLQFIELNGSKSVVKFIKN